MSNFAVLAIAMTAITPACTGSETTRSATEGTVPAMFNEMTRIPCSRTSRTALVMSPPMIAPAITRMRARGRRATARTAAARFVSPTSGIVSTEIRSPRMLCRSASLIAPSATCPTYAFPIDARKRGHFLDAHDDVQRRDVGDERCRVDHGVELDQDARATVGSGRQIDVVDVRPVLPDDARELIEGSGLVAHRDHDRELLRRRHSTSERG